MGRAHVELAPILGGRGGGRLEVGEVADRAPLVRDRAEEGPGTAGSWGALREHRIPFAPRCTQGHLDFGCRMVGIPGRRAVCLSREGKLQVSGA